VVLRQTPGVVTPFGGLSVLIEFLQKIGYRQQVSQPMPVPLESTNAIDPGETFTESRGLHYIVVVRKLFEVPGYTFRVFVTNLPDAPEQIWRDYNQRACIEQRIEERESDLAADDFCLKEFFATQAVFLGILMLFNLLAEFQRASGMTGYRQPASLRAQVFLCGAILGRAGHRTALHLSAAWGGLEKRNSLFDKLVNYEIPTSRKLESTAPARG
jgi:hypothetical protein